MNSCKEFELDDMMAIAAIPLANVPADTVSSPANRLEPVIPSAGFSPSLSGAITIGLRPVNTGGMLIPIRRGTGKAKDDETDDVAGRLHTVNISCEVDDREGDAWTRLLTLERSPRHLVLTFRGGTRAFVLATEDTYLCNVDRDGSKTTVSFRIQNLMGLQLIV